VELKSEAKPGPTEAGPPTDTKEGAEKVRVRGVLKWADATKDVETVQIVDAAGRSHRVRVPPGVDDIEASLARRSDRDR
jgi:hypothetical protein